MSLAGQQQCFISYHRSDAEIARRLQRHLGDRGVHTWMDEVNIPVGAYWPDEIDRGLAASDIVIGVLSTASIQSRNVKNEWDWAIQNHKRLILLQIDSCVIPHRYVSINLIDVSERGITEAMDEIAGIAKVEARSLASSQLPRTRYARNGDISLAYQVVGEGPIDLILVPGYISHIEHEWSEPGMVRFLLGLASFSRLINFDKRGTGLSDRTMVIPTIEQRMEDIGAVLDAAGSERAVVLGYSEGAPLSCLFAATHPDRTHALIVYGGYASEIAHDDYPWTSDRVARLESIDNDERTLHDRWGTEAYAREMTEFFAPSAVGDERLVSWIGMLLRLGGSPGASIALDRTNLEIDIRHTLTTIRVPTLVVHRTGDRACKLEEGRYVAEKIPGATFVELPGDDHFVGAGDIDGLVDTFATFVRTLESAPPLDDEIETTLATVMVVDWQEQTATSDRLPAPVENIWPIVERFRGVEISETDHDVTARFDGPVRAIRCTRAIFETLQTSQVELRAGLYTGELPLGPGESSSFPVRVARALASTSPAGEIRVSSTVKDLVAGSGLQFQPRGAQQIEGLAEEMRLFSVMPAQD